MIRNSTNFRGVKAQRALSSVSRCVRKSQIQQHANSKLPRTSARVCASRRKMAAEHCSKRRHGGPAQQLCQDGRRCCVTVKNSGEMSSRSGGQGSGTGRRRGHQHHPRNEGTRGLTIQRQQPENHSSVVFEPEPAVVVTEGFVPWVDGGTKGDNSRQEVAAVVINVDSNKFNEDSLKLTTEPDEESIKSQRALVNKDDDVVTCANRLSVINIEDDEITNENKEDKRRSDTKSSKDAVNEKRRHRSRSRPKGPRPAVEGGPGPQEESQDDPETQELARLRCTSERTELVAERENRRKNRCADYPGLAFGRSIFSSDTMMKFSIIKNELHNIMNAQLKRAESEVAALNRRIQLLEEDLERSEERLATATAKLSEASQAADESERIRKALENRTNMEDDRVAILESQLSQAKLIAEEADKKYEEVARKLVMMEQDLERAEERAEQGDSKIVELEEELRVVGNNLKSLEVSEEKATQREENFEGQVKVLDGQLKEAEARAEFAERSVQKLQKEVDRLEDDLLAEREKNKLLQEEMEVTLHDIQNM